MRAFNLLATVALTIGFCVNPISAQNTGATQQPTTQQTADAGGKIGVIDISYIFKNHPTMQSQIDAIKAQMKTAEDEINARRESVLSEIEQLKMLKEDTAAFESKEEQIANAETKLKLDFMRKEEEFAKAQAQIVANSYNQVQGLVNQIAEHNNLSLVLRYERVEMDPEKPGTVSQTVNRSVLFFKPQFDLTDVVLRAIQDSSGTGTQAANTAVAPGGPNRR